MLYFERINVSKGIDVNRTRESKECDIFLYWYFLNKDFRFQPNVCNRSHGLLMISMNLSDITISNIKIGDYRCIIRGISKNEAINLTQNADFTKKNGTLLNMKTYDHV